MTRTRPPAALDVELYHDAEPVLPLRGYTYLEVAEKALAAGDGRATVLRDTRAGRVLADVALADPSTEDLARWSVVVKPKGSKRIISGFFLDDVDVDYGWMDGAARDGVYLYGRPWTAMLAGTVVTPVAGTVPSRTGVTAAWPTVPVDARTAPAETVVLGLIADHLGPAAGDPSSRFARLRVPTSLGRGATVTSGRRFPTLLDEVRTLALEGGIMVRLVQSEDDGYVDVVVTVPALREDVSLSREQNTLLGWRLRRTAAGAGRVLILGRGDDVDRVSTEIVAPTPTGGWAYPRRVTVNATSDETLEPMRLIGRAELAELNPPRSVSVRPSPESPWDPYVDFGLGDSLKIEEGAAAVEGRVDEIITRHDVGTAPTITTGSPTVGGGRLAGAINRLTRALRREVSR